MTETNYVDPNAVRTWHEAWDAAKLATLIDSMRTQGWTGAPVVVIPREGCDPVAITGSHRITAAREVGIDVPTVNLDDLLAAEDTSLAQLDEEYGDIDGDHYEAIVRLDYHLSAEVVEIYGLDAH